MNQIISLALVVLGLVILFAPEYILKKDNSGSITDTLYEYHQMAGVALLAIAYYTYSRGEIKTETLQSIESSSTSTDNLPELPEKATSD